MVLISFKVFISSTASPNVGYGVNQWLVDGTLVQTGGTTYQLTNITANHSVTVTFVTATLTPSVSTLGLSVNCPSSSSCNPKNDALTGAARTITITNTGSVNATNVLVSSVGLPSDAIVSPASCGTIPAYGGTCVITVTPGVIASSNASNDLCTTGVQPEGFVNITADGGLSVAVNTYVLSYGCIYQGGFIYSVDDTTATNGSIGGKTAAVTDTYPGQIAPIAGIPDWGGSGTAISPSLYETNAQGANDGSANSTTIISALSPPTALSDYATGLCSTLSVEASGTASCSAPDTCYINWYLPALCELGPFDPMCTVGSTNIVEQLFDNTLIPSATLGIVDTGFYWSSTEYSVTPSSTAWAVIFTTLGSVDSTVNKSGRLGVRCSRGLTP